MKKRPVAVSRNCWLSTILHSRSSRNRDTSKTVPGRSGHERVRIHSEVAVGRGAGGEGFMQVSDPNYRGAEADGFGRPWSRGSGRSSSADGGADGGFFVRLDTRLVGD